MLLLVAVILASGSGTAVAAAESPEREAGETAALPADPAEETGETVPLAGQPYRTFFMGQLVDIPPRNRYKELALTLGGNAYIPSLGGDSVLPIAALYWRYSGEKWWTRNVFGLFVNEMDLARNLGRLQILGHLENNTIPFPDREIKKGKEVKTSSVRWGTVSGWLGVGYHLPVAPWQVDNDLKLQLYYHGGYFYASRTHDTGDNVRLPPDTYVHGLRLRARYDGLLRNIMELPHRGWAWGGDLELTRRDSWSDSSFGNHLFSREDTRDYLKFSGYVITAQPIPGLSDRHRFVGYLHGGTTAMGELDRFSAFRAGGGPFPNESGDLYRLPYPGALVNNFLVNDYVVGTLEYRLQLAFFLYLHLRGTFAWGANRPDYDGTDGLKLKLKTSDAEAFSVGLTSGFVADSQLYLEYSYDSTLLRNGRGGSSFLLLWSKSF